MFEVQVIINKKYKEEVVEWLKAVDCKSIDSYLRWFESILPQGSVVQR